MGKERGGWDQGNYLRTVVEVKYAVWGVGGRRQAAVHSVNILLVRRSYGGRRSPLRESGYSTVLCATCAPKRTVSHCTGARDNKAGKGRAAITNNKPKPKPKDPSRNAVIPCCWYLPDKIDCKSVAPAAMQKSIVRDKKVRDTLKETRLGLWQGTTISDCALFLNFFFCVDWQRR